MAFAQLTYRESLRDIEVNLRAQARRLYHMGFRCQTISRDTLANANATRPCLDRNNTTMRRIVVRDETGKRLVFLTNNFSLRPELIADLYRQRWQVELFFKWIKQHLCIKVFFSTRENAVKTQIWIAIATCLLIAIAKKRLHLDASPPI
jgi:IS4 transposase